MKLEQLEQMIKNNPDGGTILNNKYTTHKNGYQVSVKEHGIFNSLVEMCEYIYLNNLRDFGYWLYKNQYYLDYSINITNKSKALKTAKEFNQLAIWDWTNNRELVVTQK